MTSKNHSPQFSGNKKTKPHVRSPEDTSSDRNGVKNLFEMSSEDTPSSGSSQVGLQRKEEDTPEDGETPTYNKTVSSGTFNLSKLFYYLNGQRLYPEKFVKEFIERIKEYLKGGEFVKCDFMEERIDELAGDKLK
jgi:hypothetical protein